MSNTIRSLLCLLGLASAFLPGAALAQPGRTRAPAPAAVAPSAPGVVNIQTATSEQLELLPGIGPSKAAAIVAYRDQHAFRRVEDLMRVRGIGRATFRRLRSMLTVQGPTTMTERAPAPPRSAAVETDEQDDAEE